MAPLTELTKEPKNKNKRPKFVWGEEQQKAFNSLKKIVSRDICLAYPDFNSTFEIYTDASKTQLGAVIVQNNRPLAFYSRKLNPAQLNYTTTERELLSIVETLKEFRNILLGHKIKVFTDHKNLTQDALGYTSERVMRWRLLMEEFGPDILRLKILNWYHHFLNHPGETRLAKTIGQTMIWPGLTNHSKQHCHRCKNCQKNKKNGISMVIYQLKKLKPYLRKLYV